MKQNRGLLAILKHYYETIKKALGYIKTLLRNKEKGSWLHKNIIMKQRRGLMATLKPYHETMKKAHGYT